MMNFLKNLLGLGSASQPVAKATAPPTPARKIKSPDKPELPADELALFKSWFLAQRRPAIALIPDETGEIAISGSRLGGPVWIGEGESWPSDDRNVPLEFIAQLDCAECSTLGNYPANGVIQFFVGRDDLYGADFDDPSKAKMLVRWCDPTAPGSLQEPPPLEELSGEAFSDYSPFQSEERRSRGVALRSESVIDTIDQSIMEAEKRIQALYATYDIAELEAFLDSAEVVRPMRHHTGGYPAFTQSDVHYQQAFTGYDHVLLRLTSDETIMWGDVGECVFLIRPDDLKNRDFSRVAYSWDCC